jgi:hypothetical protein
MGINTKYTILEIIKIRDLESRFLNKLDINISIY